MRRDVVHLYMAILIFYSFLVDLNGKEEMVCINGRRKRIKSFVPYTEEMVSLCASSIGAMSLCASSIGAMSVCEECEIQREIRVTFIQSFIQLESFGGMG